MKKLLAILLTSALISCYSAPTPIVIRQIPQADVSADMTIDEYMKSSTEWGVKITSYVKELINQIIHKANYIDLRSDK
jgi:hypothetical protein